MKNFLVILLFVLITSVSAAQSVSAVIIDKEVKRIESVLSADSMQGRKTFTAGSEKAVAFINNEFKKADLKTFDNKNSYFQNFTLAEPKTIHVSATDGKPVDAANVIVFTCLPILKITPDSGFKKVSIKQGAAFGKEVNEFIKLKENLIVSVDISFAANFKRLKNTKQYLFKSDKSVVFVLGNVDENNFNLTAISEITENKAANITGVLPGKSKADEYVIFSAHYDHLGIGKAINNDSVFNGANDDASGVTAVIALAKYFKAANNNERTLIFAAFTAEEIGGYGSQYFSTLVDAKKTVAMFNIEMIGTESKWGKNSAYITGFEKSDMGKILQKNLAGSSFSFYPDPYPEQELFYRSDNATLARLGVAAHTISTSKMDNELNYHKLSDEVETLDIKNMTQIIRSIAISAKSIINSSDTPARLKVDELVR